MYDGLLERDVGLVLFHFKALFSHAEERDDSNKEEYKASLVFFKITFKKTNKQTKTLFSQ